jgi:hypothetical protein
MFLKVLFIGISLEKGVGFASAVSCSVLCNFGDWALVAGGLRRFGRFRLLGLLSTLVLLLIVLLLRAGLILLAGFVLRIGSHYESLRAENLPASTTPAQCRCSDGSRLIYSPSALANESDDENDGMLLGSHD